jgi:hypothetical protein
VRDQLSHPYIIDNMQLNISFSLRTQFNTFFFLF